eukprot:1143056-Pelagomonas_calceolata.AAC.2
MHTHTHAHALPQAALRASPSRVSLANARQELRRMQQGQGGMQAPARPARHFEVGSSSRSGGSGTGALVGDGLGLRSSGVFTAEAYHRWNSSLRLHALHEDAMQVGSGVVHSAWRCRPTHEKAVTHKTLDC